MGSPWLALYKFNQRFSGEKPWDFVRDENSLSNLRQIALCGIPSSANTSTRSATEAVIDVIATAHHYYYFLQYSNCNTYRCFSMFQPLMKRFQKALHKHLAKQNEKMGQEHRELVRNLREAVSCVSIPSIRYTRTFNISIILIV